ncbi:MAG: lysophospholipase [Sphingobacteriales bacterium]|nr:MAG: lysophospholipase [Sphingobacteriales bacterium]
MKKIPFNWYNTNGSKIHAQLWQSENKLEIKGVICLVHGLGEHIGRYEHFARFFVNNNYVVIACDLLGHGQSEGRRGHVGSFNQFYEQIDRLLEEASKRFPGEPKFIYGHSMGGNIVLNYAIARSPRVLGIVLSAPWLRPAMEVPASKIALTKIATVLLPWYFESNGIDINQLSRDNAVCEAYQKDPLVHDKISARLFMSITEQAEFATHNYSQLRVPVLLMHGTADGLTSYQASEEFASAAKGKVEFKSWPGFFHELHNEPEQNEVFDFVLNWIDSKLQHSTSIGQLKS